MNIDITLLNQGIRDEINIDEDVKLDMVNDDILGTNNLHLKGDITLDEIGNINLDLILTGNIVIRDSISLKEINYPIECHIDENLEKNDTNSLNSLDLSEILWQTIVLEVPLRFTEVTDLDKFKGDGWKLVTEEDNINSNNPFEDLKSMFGEE